MFFYILLGHKRCALYNEEKLFKLLIEKFPRVMNGERGSNGTLNKECTWLPAKDESLKLYDSLNARCCHLLFTVHNH